MRAGRQPGGPDFLARVLVERAEALVISGADKHHATRRDQRSAQIRSPCRRYPLGQQLIHHAQYGAPAEIARVQTDGGEKTPWRLLARVEVLVPKTRIGTAHSLVAIRDQRSLRPLHHTE